jgi:FKBP-type peptidyl-prolyl cis-trans isomerase
MMRQTTILLPLLAASAGAFTLPQSTTTLHKRSGSSSLRALSHRRDVLCSIFTAGITLATTSVEPAQALVEGNPPPSKNKKTLGEEYRQGTAALADTEEAEVLPREAYNKLSSGVIYADIAVGNGEAVKEGSRVNLQWVLRKSNGYFVDSSAVSDSVPFIFTVGDPKGAIAGLDEAIRGMKSGGTRRILIPPRLAYVDGLEDGLPGPIPAGFGPRQQMRRVMQVRKDVPGEYIFLEVKVTKVR